MSCLVWRSKRDKNDLELDGIILWILKSIIVHGFWIVLKVRTLTDVVWLQSLHLSCGRDYHTPESNNLPESFRNRINPLMVFLPSQSQPGRQAQPWVIWRMLKFICQWFCQSVSLAKQNRLQSPGTDIVKSTNSHHIYVGPLPRTWYCGSRLW